MNRRQSSRRPCAVPPMVGAPAAAEFSCTSSWLDRSNEFVEPPVSATAVVAALVSVSSLPASSVKETVTLMTFPTSPATRV